MVEKVSANWAAPYRYENDVIVGAPEARLDFIYNIENPIPGGQPLVGMTDYVEEYIPTKTGHIRMGDKTPGMIKVTLDSYHTHPGWLAVRDILMKEIGQGHHERVVTKSDIDTPETLQNFTSEIKLQLPRGYQRRFYIDPNRVRISTDDIRIFESLKLKNKFFCARPWLQPTRCHRRRQRKLPANFLPCGKTQKRFRSAS